MASGSNATNPRHGSSRRSQVQPASESNFRPASGFHIHPTNRNTALPPAQPEVREYEVENSTYGGHEIVENALGSRPQIANRSQTTPSSQSRPYSDFPISSSTQNVPRHPALPITSPASSSSNGNVIGSNVNNSYAMRPPNTVPYTDVPVLFSTQNVHHYPTQPIPNPASSSNSDNAIRSNFTHSHATRPPNTVPYTDVPIPSSTQNDHRHPTLPIASPTSSSNTDNVIRSNVPNGYATRPPNTVSYTDVHVPIPSSTQNVHRHPALPIASHTSSSNSDNVIRSNVNNSHAMRPPNSVPYTDVAIPFSAQNVHRHPTLPIPNPTSSSNGDNLIGSNVSSSYSTRPTNTVHQPRNPDNGQAWVNVNNGNDMYMPTDPRFLTNYAHPSMSSNPDIPTLATLSLEERAMANAPSTYNQPRSYNQPNNLAMSPHSDPRHFLAQPTDAALPQKIRGDRMSSTSRSPEQPERVTSGPATYRPPLQRSDIHSHQLTKPGVGAGRGKEGIGYEADVTDRSRHRPTDVPLSQRAEDLARNPTQEFRERKGYHSSSGTYNSQMVAFSQGPSLTGVNDLWNAEAGSPRSTGSSTLVGNSPDSSLSSSMIQEKGEEGYPKSKLPGSSSDDRLEDTQLILSGTRGPSSRRQRGRESETLDAQSSNQFPASDHKLQPLGNPSLVPFKIGKGGQWKLKKTIEHHIPQYMCSAIFGDLDTIQLWYPRPLLKRRNGQMRGIQVGDVVYANDSGEVCVLFNIFHSYEENWAAGATPPPKHYACLQTNLNSTDYVREVEVQRQRCFFSDNIEMRPAQPSSSGTERRYEFRTKKPTRTGAIIVLPHGGLRHSLRDNFFQLPDAKRYFRDQAPSWYQHALTLHIPPENGTLLLARETYSARTWGIATLASKEDVTYRLTAEFCRHGPNPLDYIWTTQDNRWKTNVGPSSTELDALRQGSEPPLNQCIGVVLSSLRLDDQTWHTHFVSKSARTTPEKEKKSMSPLRRLHTRSSSEMKSGRASISQSERSRWSILKTSLKGKGKHDGRSTVDMEGDVFGDYDLLIQET